MFLDGFFVTELIMGAREAILGGRRRLGRLVAVLYVQSGYVLLSPFFLFLFGGPGGGFRCVVDHLMEFYEVASGNVILAKYM